MHKNKNKNNNKKKKNEEEKKHPALLSPNQMTTMPDMTDKTQQDLKYGNIFAASIHKDSQT